MYATSLRMSDPFAVEDHAEARPSLAAEHPARGGYAHAGGGASRMAGIAAVIAIHLLLLAAFLNLGFGRHYRHQPRPLVVNVVPVEVAPPPPPRAPPTPERKRVETPIVAETPIVQTPAAPPPVATTPAPQPPAPPAVVAAPAPVAVAAPGPVSIGRLAQMPGNPPLRSPVSARMRHEEGIVRLRILVGTDGKVEDIAVAQSSGSDSLDKAALEVVRRWRFVPPTRDGVAVEGVGIFPAAFKLA